jgi:hypothetical protein
LKIIDCHVHPWVEIRKGVYWGDIEKILDSARRNGISKICLSSPGNGRFQAYPTSKDVSLANDAVL